MCLQTIKPCYSFLDVDTLKLGHFFTQIHRKKNKQFILYILLAE